MPSKEWERQQLAKKNAVVVKFEDLNPAVQYLISHGTFFNLEIDAEKSLRNLRRWHGVYNTGLGQSLASAIALAASKDFGGASISAGLTSFMAATRIILPVKAIQKKHAEIADEMKRVGILKSGNSETNYPSDWINPAIVGQTHPIFSVRRNGDIVFRKVTWKEFQLLRQQEKMAGKLGINPWRWRSTLRKPKAPEVERKKVLERLKAVGARWRPAVMPGFQPSLVPARKNRFLFRRK